MSTDNLDTLSDAQLDECFSAELAGWTFMIGRFSTDADAILPHVEKWMLHDPDDRQVNIRLREQWSVELADSTGWFDGYADKLARAACIALIRANRSAKAEAETK